MGPTELLSKQRRAGLDKVLTRAHALRVEVLVACGAIRATATVRKSSRWHDRGAATNRVARWELFNEVPDRDERCGNLNRIWLCGRIKCAARFRRRVHECAPDLAKKLRRALTGRFARTAAVWLAHLHIVSGRHTHTYRRDGEFQTGSWPPRRRYIHPDCPVFSTRNGGGSAAITPRAALEKNQRDNRGAVVVRGNDK
jgi:hypothetical protein